MDVGCSVNVTLSQRSFAHLQLMLCLVWMTCINQMNDVKFNSTQMQVARLFST